MAGGKIPIGSRDAAGACGAPAAMIPRGPLPRDILYSIGRVKRECRRVRKAAFGNGDRDEDAGSIGGWEAKLSGRLLHRRGHPLR